MKVFKNKNSFWSFYTPPHNIAHKYEGKFEDQWVEEYYQLSDEELLDKAKVRQYKIAIAKCRMGIYPLNLGRILHLLRTPILLVLGLLVSEFFRA